MFFSKATTNGVEVEVKAEYDPRRSDPSSGRWFFAYHIRIANNGTQIVQLVSRHWIITDALGIQEEVRGPGVVGRQPILRPGESFEYASFCPLRTPFGSMQGAYQMITPGGDVFEAAVAPFALSQPLTVN